MQTPFIRCALERRPLYVTQAQGRAVTKRSHWFSPHLPLFFHEANNRLCARPPHTHLQIAARQLDL